MQPIIYTAPLRLGFWQRLGACLRIMLLGRVDVQVLIERHEDGTSTFKETVVHFGGTPGGVPETSPELALPAPATP